MARVVVELVKFKGAWVARSVEDPSGDVLFVRKSSLRDKSQFSAAPSTPASMGGAASPNERAESVR